MPKNTKIQHLQREVGRLFGIVFASFFFAMGYSWFLLPYNMAPGGVGGISQILYHFLGIPNGVSMIILNIPLFIISFNGCPTFNVGSKSNHFWICAYGAIFT